MTVCTRNDDHLPYQADRNRHAGDLPLPQSRHRHHWQLQMSSRDHLVLPFGEEDRVCF